MFFGKNKNILKLKKACRGLELGESYHIMSSIAPDSPKVLLGVGFEEIMLKNSGGDDFRVCGSAVKIREFFEALETFENTRGKLVKVERAFGVLKENDRLKEISTKHHDEKIQLGVGITECFYIQQHTDKIFKVCGNYKQIQHIFKVLEG